MIIRKDLLETEAQQKVLRGALKSEFEKMKAEMKADMKIQQSKESDA